MPDNDRYPPLRLSWGIWGLGALLYLVSFYQRVAPAVMTDELMADFALNATALGNLSAFYFYSYVAMQVPTGLLADYWGPRKLLSLGALVAAAGTLMFAVSPDIIWAGIGRLMVGASVAVAFIAILKLSAHWLPHRQYALASGFALFIGVIGAVSAGAPLRLLIDGYGWRTVMLLSAMFTLSVCMLIWFLVRDDPTQLGYRSYYQGSTGNGNKTIGIGSAISEALRYRNIRLLTVIPGGIASGILSFAGLWGVPFFTTHYDMSKTKAAAFCSLLMVAWAIGGPVFGWFSDHLGIRKALFVVACASLTVLWWLLLMIPGWSDLMLTLLLSMLGLLSGVIVLSFAFARESAPSYLTGTCSGITNMGVMAGPMLAQPAIGLLLDLQWQGEMREGVRVYSEQAYHLAFYLPVAWLAVSVVLALMTRETYCRPMDDRN